MRRIIYIYILAALLGGVLLEGCSSSRNAYNRDDIYGEQRHGGKKDKDNKKPAKPVRDDKHTRRPDVPATELARRVLDEAYGMLGTRYRHGGNSRSGVDCSGLTCIAFERGAGIKLPRNSAEQRDFCRVIRRDELIPGDLVFFSSRVGGDRINHVAIYVGDNSIIHSTSSRGVIVSDLDDYYWRTHFSSCGRVLKN